MEAGAGRDEERARFPAWGRQARTFVCPESDCTKTTPSAPRRHMCTSLSLPAVAMIPEEEAVSTDWMGSRACHVICGRRISRLPDDMSRTQRRCSGSSRTRRWRRGVFSRGEERRKQGKAAAAAPPRGGSTPRLHSRKKVGQNTKVRWLPPPPIQAPSCVSFLPLLPGPSETWGRSSRFRGDRRTNRRFWSSM
jgi:hypothetical protein